MESASLQPMQGPQNIIQTDETTASYLPNEILLKIFAELKFREQSIASLVCRKWHQILTDPYFVELHELRWLKNCRLLNKKPISYKPPLHEFEPLESIDPGYSIGRTCRHISGRAFLLNHKTSEFKDLGNTLTLSAATEDFLIFCKKNYWRDYRSIVYFAEKNYEGELGLFSLKEKLEVSNFLTWYTFPDNNICVRDNCNDQITLIHLKKNHDNIKYTIHNYDGPKKIERTSLWLYPSIFLFPYIWMTGHIIDHSDNSTERIHYTFNILKGQYEENDRFDPIFHCEREVFHSSLYAYGNSKAGNIMQYTYPKFPRNTDIFRRWSISNGKTAKLKWSATIVAEPGTVCHYSSDKYFVIIMQRHKIVAINVNDGGTQTSPIDFDLFCKFIKGNFLIATSEKPAITICHLPSLTFQQFPIDQENKIIASYIAGQQFHVITYKYEDFRYEENELWTFG